jgi:hypothetical protein
LKIIWDTEKSDIETINHLIKSQSDKKFVLNRLKKNVDINYLPKFNKELFWEAMILCLLSSQQRSGPASPISRFYSKKPFPLSLNNCSLSKNLESFVKKCITDFGGIRFVNKISERTEENLSWLNSGGWDQINVFANNLLESRKRPPKNQDIKLEINAANFLNENLKGFGPKQSRNLWQTLGLFRYEIPIDSRITKWLNKNIYPFKLSADALSDPNFYQFVMKGIQKISEDSGILPCVFDAAIFSTYDKEWDVDIW